MLNHKGVERTKAPVARDGGMRWQWCALGWTDDGSDAILPPTGSEMISTLAPACGLGPVHVSAKCDLMSIGTRIFTMLFGKRVGADAFGNQYYRNAGMKRYGRERRWVIYNGLPEASKVPAEWHAWLHHIVDEPPVSDAAPRRWPWQKAHLPNLSGTPYAYRPQGHDLRGGNRARATGDYEPWTPE